MANNILPQKIVYGDPLAHDLILRTACALGEDETTFSLGQLRGSLAKRGDWGYDMDEHVQFKAVSRILARLASDLNSPILRVGSPRSGTYIASGATGAELRKLKAEQPTSGRIVKQRASKPASELRVGTALRVIEIEGDLALVKTSAGRYYRIVMERVLK